MDDDDKEEIEKKIEVTAMCLTCIMAMSAIFAGYMFYIAMWGERGSQTQAPWIGMTVIVALAIIGKYFLDGAKRWLRRQNQENKT